MKKILFRSLIILITASGVFSMMACGRGVTQEQERISAIDNTSGAIVGVINMYQNTTKGEGSGVVYKVENGDTYIVTNEHVVANGDYFEIVFSNGDRYETELVGSDIYTDLAVLRLAGFEANTVGKFGNTEDLLIGQTVMAIGNPLGLRFASSATSGIVSGQERTVNVTLNNELNEEWEMTVLQTDVAINPGNSGGALINLDGEVVGINSMKIASESIEGMSFSIPTYIANPIIVDLETHGEVLRPKLGINIINMSAVPDRIKEMFNIPVEQRTGVFVDDVMEDSQADHMAMQINDVIIAINNVDVEDTLRFSKELFTYREGDEIIITVLRGDTIVDLTTTVTV